MSGELKYPRYPNTPRTIAALKKALVDFGYANLTTQHVEDQFNLVQAGKDYGPTDGGLTVIGMFIESQLKEASR